MPEEIIFLAAGAKAEMHAAASKNPLVFRRALNDFATKRCTHDGHG